MDPLSITGTAVGLAASIFGLTKSIGAFVTTARSSRAELEAVCRELVSLQIGLEVLESDQRNGTKLGQELEVSVRELLVNIELTCGQIKSTLAKLESSRFGRPIKWAFAQKDEVNELRSSLETHKSALQMVLQLNTISIIVRESRSLKASQPSPSHIQQAHEAYSTVRQIDQKLDVLTERQQDSPALQRLRDAMAELSSTVKVAVTKHDNLARLAQQSCRFVEQTLKPVQDTETVQEIRTKLQRLVEDPFADPFHEVSAADKQCLICAGDVDEDNHSTMQTRLYQLKADWRHKWLKELKQEIETFSQPGNQFTTQTSPRPTTTALHTHRSSSSDLGEVIDLMSEVMTIRTTLHTDDDQSRASDARSVSDSWAKTMSTNMSTNTRTSDLTARLQRLQSKADSTQKRNQILIEEITDLKSENLELQHDVSRLQDRLANARAAPARRAESLQQDYHHLQEALQEKQQECESLQRTQLEDTETHRLRVSTLEALLTSSREEIKTLKEAANKEKESSPRSQAEYKRSPSAKPQTYKSPPQVVPKIHTRTVNSVACSPDGSTFASGSDDKLLVIYDSATGTPLQRLEHKERVLSIAYSPDGTNIASASSKRPFSGRDRRHRVLSGDDLVSIWEAKSGRLLRQLRGHESYINSVACSPDGTKIVSGSADRSIRVWQASTGVQLQYFNCPSIVIWVACSPDGTKIVGAGDGWVKVWDATTGKQLSKIGPVDEDLYSVAYSPNGTDIALGDYDGTIKIWDVITSTLRMDKFEGPGEIVYCLAYSPDGTKIAAGISYSIRIYDVYTGDLVWYLSTNQVYTLTFALDGNDIISGSLAGEVSVYDVTALYNNRQRGT